MDMQTESEERGIKSVGLFVDNTDIHAQMEGDDVATIEMVLEGVEESSLCPCQRPNSGVGLISLSDLAAHCPTFDDFSQAAFANLQTHISMMSSETDHASDCRHRGSSGAWGGLLQDVFDVENAVQTTLAEVDTVFVSLSACGEKLYEKTAETFAPVTHRASSVLPDLDLSEFIFDVDEILEDAESPMWPGSFPSASTPASTELWDEIAAESKMLSNRLEDADFHEQGVDRGVWDALSGWSLQPRIAQLLDGDPFTTKATEEAELFNAAAEAKACIARITTLSSALENTLLSQYVLEIVSDLSKIYTAMQNNDRSELLPLWLELDAKNSHFCTSPAEIVRILADEEDRMKGETPAERRMEIILACLGIYTLHTAAIAASPPCEDAADKAKRHRSALVLCAIDSLCTTLDALFATFKADPSLFHLLGYMPVDGPNGWDKSMYRNLRKFLCSTPTGFPSSGPLQDVTLIAEAHLFSPPAPDLRRRLALLKKLNNLGPGWELLIAPAACMLVTVWPMFVLFSDNVSSRCATRSSPMVESSMHTYFSHVYAQVHKVDQMFGETKVFHLSDGFCVSNRKTCAKEETYWGTRQPLGPFLETTQRMFDAGIMPVVAGGYPYVSPCAFSVWSAAVADAEGADEIAQKALASRPLEDAILSLGVGLALGNLTQEKSARTILTAAAFTFEAGVHVRIAVPSLSEDHIVRAREIVEYVGPFSVAVVFRYCVSVFASSAFIFSNAAEADDAHNLVCASPESKITLETFNGATSRMAHFVANAFGKGSGAPICTASEVAGRFAAVFLSPVGYDADWLFENVPDICALDFSCTRKFAVAVANTVGLGPTLRAPDHRWGRTWNVAHRSVANLHLTPFRLARLSNSGDNYGKTLQTLANYLAPQTESERSSPAVSILDLDVESWSEDELVAFVRRVAGAFSVPLFLFYMHSDHPDLPVTLDVGETRDVMRVVWARLTKHAIFEHKEDGTVMFSGTRVENVCTTCSSRGSGVNCKLFTSVSMEGIARLFLMSHIIMAGDVTGKIRQPSTRFTFPFALDRGQALMILCHMFGLHVHSELNRNSRDVGIPSPCGDSGMLFPVGTQCVPATSVDKLLQRRSNGIPSCTCKSPMTVDQVVDDANNLHRIGALNECCWHAPINSETLFCVSRPGMRDRLSIQRTAFATFLLCMPSSILSRPGMGRVPFAVWYADVFQAHQHTLSHAISSRLRFVALDDDWRDVDIKHYLSMLRVVTIAWLSTADDQTIRRFLLLCTGQEYLRPSSCITFALQPPCPDDWETKDQRDSRVDYQTCFARSIVPLPILEFLMEELAAKSAGPEFNDVMASVFT